MRDTATRSFVPPHWPAATGDPSFRDLFRAAGNTLLGWSNTVYEGGCYQAGLPGAPLVVGDAAMAEAILFDQGDAFPHGEQFNRLFRPVWGDGIFVSEGDRWRWQRRAAAPAFHAGRMRDMTPIMRSAAEDMVLRMTASTSPADLQVETHRLTLRVLLDAALSGGEDFPDIAVAGRHLEQFLSGVGRFTLTDFFPMPHNWRPSTRSRGGNSNAWLRERVEAMVARRRDAPPRSDLVDMLLQASDPVTGQRMDDALVRDNLMGFIAAGHSTSAHALAWALWLIASHPPTEDRLRQEIASVAGDAPISIDHLDSLVFTRQVLQETMRLYPGAVAIVRSAARNTEVCGRHIRQGTLVVIATYALHRRPEFWPDPHAFNPDRFAPENGASGRPRLAYVPFGGGARICMGAAFAMTELLVALATLVRALHVELVPDRPLQLGVRLAQLVGNNGMWVRFRPK